MPLESLHSSDIDIHDLSPEVPEGREPLKFDPEKEISNEDWQWLVENLDYIREEKRWSDYIHHARLLKFLMPARVGEFGLDNALWERIKTKLSTDLEEHQWLVGYAREAAEARDLFPEHAGEVDRSESVLVRLERELIDTRDEQLFHEYLIEAVNLKLLAPQRFPESSFDEKIKQKLAGLFTRGLRDESERWRFYHELAQFRLLCPEAFSRLGIVVPFWQDLDGLASAKQKNLPGHYAEFAVDSVILTADEVNVTEQGIQVVNHRSFDNSPPPLPPVRAF